MNELAELYSRLGQTEGLLLYISAAIRWMLPFLAVWVVARCARSFFCNLPEQEVWGHLTPEEGGGFDLQHYELTVGRGKANDICLTEPSVKKLHAVLTRTGEGIWSVTPMGRRCYTAVNRIRIKEKHILSPGDELTLGKKIFTFASSSGEEERTQAYLRTKPGFLVRPGVTLFLLTDFQLLLCMAHWIQSLEEMNLMIPIAFGALILGEWIYYAFMRSLRRTGVEPEILAFFLCTLGVSVVATSAPEALYKELIFIGAGVFCFLVLGWILRDLDRVKRLRIPAACGGLLLLAANLLLGGKIFGARNWLSIGGFSLQPSEFVKICFVFVGAATLERLYHRGNLIWYCCFSGACVLALALMGDFGTASVFFVGYLLMSFLRSGNVATVILSLSGAAMAGLAAITAKPYIASRFSTWLHAWEDPSGGGYQQTRTMMAAANGGLFGVGAGSGSLHKVFAADTDMVFGMVCEELGLIIGLTAVAAFAIMVIFVVRWAGKARSSFYVIAACGALGMLLFQIALNMLGAFDILPFTGVTFPFISRGGSSMISCWCLLAYIKAADTRQNASFAVKLPKNYRQHRRGVEEEESEGRG